MKRKEKGLIHTEHEYGSVEGFRVGTCMKRVFTRAPSKQVSLAFRNTQIHSIVDSSAYQFLWRVGLASVIPALVQVQSRASRNNFSWRQLKFFLVHGIQKSSVRNQYLRCQIY